MTKLKKGPSLSAMSGSHIQSSFNIIVIVELNCSTVEKSPQK